MAYRLLSTGVGSKKPCGKPLSRLSSKALRDLRVGLEAASGCAWDVMRKTRYGEHRSSVTYRCTRDRWFDSMPDGSEESELPPRMLRMGRVWSREKEGNEEVNWLETRLA